MARLPYPDPVGFPPATSAALSRLPAPLNAFQMLAHAPDLVAPVIDLGIQILAAGQLHPRLRETAILRLAARRGIDYELAGHLPMARAAGLADQVIEAITGPGPVGQDLDPVTTLVLDVTDALVDTGTVDPALFARLAAALPPREIIELVTAIGYYLMIGQIMTVLDVEIDSSNEAFVRDAPHWVHRDPAPPADPA